MSGCYCQQVCLHMVSAFLEVKTGNDYYEKRQNDLESSGLDDPNWHPPDLSLVMSHPRN